MTNDLMPTSNAPETTADNAPETITGSNNIALTEAETKPEPENVSTLTEAAAPQNGAVEAETMTVEKAHDDGVSKPNITPEPLDAVETTNHAPAVGAHNATQDFGAEHANHELPVNEAHITNHDAEAHVISQSAHVQDPVVANMVSEVEESGVAKDVQEQPLAKKVREKKKIEATPIIEEKISPLEEEGKHEGEGENVVNTPSAKAENKVAETAVTEGGGSVAPVAAQAHEPGNNMIPEILSKIRARIDGLELQPLETPENFKAFWSQVKVTNENFKHYSKLIPKDEHEVLWKRFDQLCERAKETQEKIKSRFENASRTKRQLIESAVTEASDLIATDLIKADLLLRRALKFLKDDWSDIKDTISLTEEELKVRMGREDQDAAWQLWKSTNEHYMTQQQELRQNNFIAINREVMDLKAPVETGDPFEALALIKNMQSKLRGMHLPKGDWEEIQNVLREYWDLADKRVKQAKQSRTVERRNKDSIFVIKHQQWITRQESNVQRFKDLIRKNEEVLKNLEQHTEKLKNDLTTAMSDKFKDKIEEWIKEKENKIADIIRTNADLEKRIIDINKKLVEGNIDDEGSSEKPAQKPAPAQKETIHQSEPANVETVAHSEHEPVASVEMAMDSAEEMHTRGTSQHEVSDAHAAATTEAADEAHTDVQS